MNAIIQRIFDCHPCKYDWRHRAVTMFQNAVYMAFIFREIKRDRDASRIK